MGEIGLFSPAPIDEQAVIEFTLQKCLMATKGIRNSRTPVSKFSLLIDIVKSRPTSPDQAPTSIRSIQNARRQIKQEQVPHVRTATKMVFFSPAVCNCPFLLQLPHLLERRQASLGKEDTSRFVGMVLNAICVPCSHIKPLATMFHTSPHWEKQKANKRR